MNHKLIHCRRILFLCVESSSYFNCRDLSASAQQILRYSSISWPSLCVIFLESFFLISNSSHSQPFFSFEFDQTIDVLGKDSVLRVGAVSQFHKEQHQHVAFSNLFCPNQIALPIILTELQSLNKSMISCLFKEVMNIFVRTEFFPFPFENLARSPILDFFYFSTTVSRRLKTAQRQVWTSPRLKTDQRPASISPRLNVSENRKHRMG